jgi:ATP-binding cassette subfamily B protein
MTSNAALEPAHRHADASAMRNEIRCIVREARWVLASLPPRYKRTLHAALGLMAAAAVANAMVPLSIGLTLDAVLRGRVTGAVATLPYLAALAGVFLFRELMTLERKIVVERAATNIEQMALLGAVEATFRAPLAAIAEERLGSMHSRLRRSVDGLVRYVKLGFLDFLPALANALFAITAAIARQPVVGLFILLVVPVGGYIVLRQLASQRGVRLRLLRTKEVMDGTLVEQLNGIETVRAADTLAREMARTAAVAEELRGDEMAHHRAMATFDAGKSLNEGFFHLAVLAVAVALMAAGRISTGDVLTFSMLFLAAVTPLREIHRILDEAHESSLQVENLRDILGQPADPSFATRDAASNCANGEVVVAARGVIAGYGAVASAPVLRHVTFTVRRGEIVGVAGPSGSGKSTLLRLLLRLVPSAAGELLVNGMPIGDVSRAEIARTFAFVSQTPFLFAGTIFDNIAYECPQATADEVREAARLAQMEGEIARLDGGYQALVAERGQNLSVGQRQRIALARAFLKRAPVLILDEGTSALDNISESGVLDVIRRRLGSTVIMVAHRMSSLRYADRILVFDRGTVVESGTFPELAAQGGAFASLLEAAEMSSPAAPGSEPCWADVSRAVTFASSPSGELP